MRKMFLFIAAVMCWAMTAQAETWTSGACTVTLENGVMTVSGNGAMADYVDYTLRPWNTYISHITSIVIEEGVTAVGYNSFYSCDALTSLSIAKSVTVIMEYAFDIKESNYNPYTLLISGKITPVNSTLGIEFENTVGSPYAIASDYV